MHQLGFAVHTPLGAFLTLLLAVFAAGCHSDATVEGTPISGVGTIRYVQLEGGFFGIVADGGERYLPENLDKDFQQDRLRVSFEGVLTDRPNFAMWGRTLHLNKIEKLSPG